MITLIVLAVYILGEYTAYHKIQKWSDFSPSDAEDMDTLFMASLLSWVVFIIYGIVWLMHKVQEE